MIFYYNTLHSEELSGTFIFFSKETPSNFIHALSDFDICHYNDNIFFLVEDENVEEIFSDIIKEYFDKTDLSFTRDDSLSTQLTIPSLLITPVVGNDYPLFCVCEKTFFEKKGYISDSHNFLLEHELENLGFPRSSESFFEYHCKEDELLDILFSSKLFNFTTDTKFSQFINR